MFEIFYCELQKGLDDLESENIFLFCYGGKINT